MSQFLQDNYDNKAKAKAIAIPEVFYENSRSKNKTCFYPLIIYQSN